MKARIYERKKEMNMLRTHKYVIEQLTNKTMELLSRPNEVRYFVINGCSCYMCWLNEKQIAFGSGAIERIIHNQMDEEEIRTLFTTYIDAGYSEKIAYNFWKEIKTMNNLKEVAPWFNMWKGERCN